jgi:hypothetical protein
LVDGKVHVSSNFGSSNIGRAHQIYPHFVALSWSVSIPVFAEHISCIFKEERPFAAQFRIAQKEKRKEAQFLPLKCAQDGA